MVPPFSHFPALGRPCRWPDSQYVPGWQYIPTASNFCLLWCRAQRPCVAHATDSSVALPKPVVKIDNSTDPFATVVKVEFGDRLGELLDTVRH